MKKTLISALILSLLLSQTPAIAEDQTTDYVSDLSKMITENDSDDYIGSLTLQIGSSVMSLDGEEITIDEQGSTPKIENDSTLLPIRGVAEALGVDVGYDQSDQTVSLMSEETDVEITLNSTEIEINGETSQMPVAAKIENDRTLIPLRAATEALGCDVSWDGETQTIVLTKPYQTKRVIVMSDDADTTGAAAVARDDDMTVMQFETEAAAREAVERNEKKGLIASPDYVYAETSMSWGTDKINAPAYYSAYSGSQSDITVAVIDSGLDSSNSCFNNKVVQGYDFYHGDSNPEDADGHGTHVAGIVADVTAGFDKVKIMPLRTANDNGSSFSSTVALAVNHAVENGADVINLSMAGQHDDPTQRRAVENAINNNVTVVASAGNDRVDLNSVFYSPACIPGVVTVSALTESNQKADYSNYGSGIIDIAAPGNNITSAAIGGGTTVKHGTSMASPHIAGVIALLRSVNPSKSSTDIISLMKSAADNLGNNAYYGAGIPNLSRLVPSSDSVSVTTGDATNVTYTNATVNGSASYSGTRPSEAGIYFGTSSGSMSKVARDTINHNKNPFDMWYDLNSEAGQYLSAGTTYYYQCYVIQNGTEYKGDIKSFTTKSQNSSASVTTKDATNVTYTNATVNGSASYSGTRPSEAGIYFGTSSGSMSKVARDTINHNKNPFDMWYDLNSEAGQYLSAGTTYYYQCYVIQNGTEYKGEVKSFTTPSSEPSPSTPTPTPNGSTSYVINTHGDTLAINSQPNANSYIGEIPEGAAVIMDLSKTSGNWRWVMYNGISGYSYAAYLTPIDGEPTKTGVVVNTRGDTLAINSYSNANDMIGEMPEGAQMTVYTGRTVGNWYWVCYNGTYGYAYKDYIALQ